MDDAESRVTEQTPSEVKGTDITVPVTEPAPAWYIRLYRTVRDERGPHVVTWLRERKYPLLLGVVLILGAVGIASLLLTRMVHEPMWLTYSGSYRLVPETISQSAAIAISIPDGAGTVAPEQVSFTPKILGEFIPSDDEGVLLYQPKEVPELDSYYHVSLSYNETTIGADFRIAEDPSVLAVLPTADAEVHENTEISVIFSRPMVPLTTRAEMDKAEVPVTLEPDVPGIWKWKSTRLLQFIPEERLARATTYTVTINEGFRSLDGVPVQGFTHTFTTRTLKHQPLTSSVRFNKPLEIVYNQPVDLKRTAHDITLIQNGKPVEAIIEYASTKTKRPGFIGLALFGAKDEVDTSRIWVRPLKDTHGRDGLWDFESSYTLTVGKQYPLEGNVVDTHAFTWTYRMPTVLSSFGAESERSSFVQPMFFDTTGVLTATFYEPVSITNSTIGLRGLRDVRYGKTCNVDEDGNTIYNHETKKCEEVDDKHVLKIRVAPGSYRPDDSADITFEKVVNEDGLILNDTPIVRTIKTVPTLKVLNTEPNEGTTTASLTTLTFCTNTPLKQPESVRDMLSVSGYVVYPRGPWRNSFKVTYGTHTCKNGEFQTTIRYGLHPETPYTLGFKLEDAFGAHESRELHITTEPAPSKYTRFYNLQKWYNVTTPGKTRLTYAVENLPDVTAHLCKVHANDFLKILEENSLSEKLPPSSLCTSIRTAVIDLPDTNWVNNYFYFDIADYFEDPRGHYIISFTNSNYRNSKGVQRYDHTLLTVSNLTVGEKRLNMYNRHANTGNAAQTIDATRTAKVASQNLYWVVNAHSLLPVQGASVTSYKRIESPNRSSEIETSGVGTTNGDGVARIAADGTTRGAVVTFGGDTAVVSANTDTLMREWGRGADTSTYLYTDRPMYRPGDTVFIKGIDRIGYDNVWHVTEGYEADVEVTNSRGDVISKQTVTVSRYGTFDISLELPKDAPLGRYRITTLGSYGWFDVKEYVGAPFKVEVTPDEAEYIAGDDAHITVHSRYYFDMPVANGTVEYTILAQDYYFDRYQDEYFNFGRGWYSCYWCGYGDDFITRGTVTLDEDGKASIELPLDFKKYFDEPDKEGSKIFTLIARVRDASGKSVSAQDSLIVHRGEFYLGVKTDTYVATKGDSVTVRVKTVDTDGKPIGVSNIALTATRVEWESYRRREVDGGYYWHSDEKRTQVEKRTVATDRDGNASSQFVFPEPGSYELSVKRTDTKGNVLSATTRIYVSGADSVSVRPTNNETLSLKTDKPSYASGEEATLLIESPFEKARALITVERGDVYKYWTKDVSGSLFTQTIPLVDTYTPSVYASVLLLGPGPEVKYGSIPVQINADVHELNIDVTPSKQSYLPGEAVELLVHATNHDGEPVSADVSVAVVDMSVLALVGNPKKNPVRFFYGTLPLGVSTAHSAKNLLIQQDIPTGTKGGGGGGADDLESRKRGIFKDTAYWQASVITDEHGDARVRFTLPDNLTTWQVESLGVTEDTRIGVDYEEFTTKKRLMAIPLRPRFVIPGDTMWLGMQVANNTDKDTTVRTHIESDTLRVIDADAKSVRVKAGTQKVVYFATEAPRERTEGTHVVTFYAHGDDLQDVVEQSIPILEDKTYEVTTTAGMTTQSLMTESVYIPDYALPDEGELTVHAQSTLIASMLDAVKDMSEYPYGCSEQIASKLASLATIRRTGALFGEDAVSKVNQIVFENKTYSVDETIQVGLAKLLSRQNYDGGFAFYDGGRSSMYLTVEVVNALTVLRDAGYQVPDDVFARAAPYITNKLARMGGYSYDNDLVARIAFALASPYVPDAERKKLVPRVLSITADKLKLEQLSTTALGYLTIATYSGPYSRTVADTLYASLQNRLTIDARGAYVQSNSTGGYSWFESNEKNTALLLRAIAQRGGDHASLDNILRWLLANKRESGGWGSTNATFTVLDAALRLVEARQENHSSYLLSLFKDNQEEATHTVTPTNLFDSLTYTFPLTNFTRETLHQIALKKSEDQGAGTVYYDMQLRYALPPDLVPPRDEGITVERSLYIHGTEEPTNEAKVGDLVTGRLTITVPKNYHAVSIESFIPAGFEIVNFSFATEQSLDLVYADDGTRANSTTPRWNDPVHGPRRWPVSYQELHDDRVFIFAEEVHPGTYAYEYTLRALIPGTYRHMPATVREMYTPEVFGRTEGSTFTITED